MTVLAAGACSHPSRSRQLPIDAIKVTGDARLRTDAVGVGPYAEQASFVLVDAENTAGEGAYVTLGGALTDDHDTVLGTLRPQSLWIPSHDTRTFALVDEARKPRPTSTSASVVVKGTLVPTSPPPAAIEELHEFKDADHVVEQAYVVNRADRLGHITVIASFHDASGRPQTRPFDVMQVAPKARASVQFVGPPGSVRGTIFVGDVLY